MSPSAVSNSCQRSMADRRDPTRASMSHSEVACCAAAKQAEIARTRKGSWLAPCASCADGAAGPAGTHGLSGLWLACRRCDAAQLQGARREHKLRAVEGGCQPGRNYAPTGTEPLPRVPARGAVARLQPRPLRPLVSSCPSAVVHVLAVKRNRCGQLCKPRSPVPPLMAPSRVTNPILRQVPNGPRLHLPSRTSNRKKRPPSPRRSVRVAVASNSGNGNMFSVSGRQLATCYSLGPTL